jgi:hypothetical protein
MLKISNHHPGHLAESQTPDRFALNGCGRKSIVLLHGRRSNEVTFQRRSSRPVQLQDVIVSCRGPDGTLHYTR